MLVSPGRLVSPRGKVAGKPAHRKADIESPHTDVSEAVLSPTFSANRSLILPASCENNLHSMCCFHKEQDVSLLLTPVAGIRWKKTAEI
ncbi:MAG: hypothetical protein WCK86_00940 [Planctomycetia bacterium]